jgi:hypothetical protein
MQLRPLELRLGEEAKRLRQKASRLPAGPEREELMQKAREAETTADMVNWINSPGLQPPS